MYQMKDIVHGYLLFKSIFEITSEKVENLFMEIPFFEVCVEILTHLVLEGLKSCLGCFNHTTRPYLIFWKCIVLITHLSNK